MTNTETTNKKDKTTQHTDKQKGQKKGQHKDKQKTTIQIEGQIRTTKGRTEGSQNDRKGHKT